MTENCINTEPLFPYGCKIHNFFSPCHINRRNESASSTFLNCPICRPSPAHNQIINNLNGMNLPDDNQAYITLDNLKTILSNLEVLGRMEFNMD